MARDDRFDLSVTKKNTLKALVVLGSYKNLCIIGVN